MRPRNTETTRTYTKPLCSIRPLRRRTFLSGDIVKPPVRATIERFASAVERLDAHAVGPLDYERESKMRQVRRSQASELLAGELVRVGVGGAEVDCHVVDIAAGVLTVTLKPAAAKAAPRSRATKKKTTA